jgi:hypothetical protein
MMVFPPGFPAAATRCAGLATRRWRQLWRLPPIAAVALLLTAAVSVWIAPAGWQPARAATLKFRCTNPLSGTSWNVLVDSDRGVVDSNAATITDQWISWHDPKQGYFDLQRATGKLRLRNASSTGGYFLYYTCRPE